MEEVDGVTLRLTQAQCRAVIKLYHQSQQAGRKAGTKNREHFGKQNNRGRFCWRVKTLCPVEESVAGLKWACQTGPDQTGEYMVYMVFEVLVHHNTVRKLLKKNNVQYISGVTQGECERVLKEGAALV